MISLQFYQVLLTALLPVFSTIVAGAARQDKAPNWLNDLISFVTPLGAGVINTVANGAPANGNGLLFFVVSALIANLAHAPFLYTIQQQLQSRLLSLGVKPAQIQALESDMVSMAPQILQSLNTLAAIVGSHGGAIGTLIDEVRKINAAPVAAPATQTIQPLANTTAAQQIGVPVVQQSFPGQPLNWTGLVQAVTPQQ